MSNRRFEMYHYRQVIHRMRMGQSDRAIAQTKLIGRAKCAEIRVIAERNGWLSPGPLPEDEALAEAFDKAPDHNPTHQSESLPYEQQIRQWFKDGVCGTTIHQALREQFGFTGSYSSIRRMLQKLRASQPAATCILDFAPGEAAQVDFGLKPLKAIHDEDFHDLISERYERKSTIVTSNLDVPEWPDAFPNRILGAATIDRLCHGAYKVVLEGKSYRSTELQLKALKTVGPKTEKKTPQKGGEIA
jgi:hypothetical protein